MPGDDVDVTRARMLLQMWLRGFPDAYASLDCNRMMLLYFSLSGLQLLGDDVRAMPSRDAIVEWVYAQQVLPSDADADADACGFRGGSFAGAPFTSGGSPANSAYDCGHIAMTYVALASLLLLGDDLSRVRRSEVCHAIGRLQQPDGSFRCTLIDSESDVRFVYCACVVATMLQCWDGVDRARALDFVRRSRSYDFAFAQRECLESHGGSTYCAVAALSLLGELDAVEHRDELVRWCLNRQSTGFQGRVNKPADSCYSFWIGASLQMLGNESSISLPHLNAFLTQCQTKHGGFSKHPGTGPDPVHTYFSLAGLSLVGAPGVEPLNAAFGLPARTVDWWRTSVVPLLTHAAAPPPPAASS